MSEVGLVSLGFFAFDPPVADAAGEVATVRPLFITTAAAGKAWLATGPWGAFAWRSRGRAAF